ncbi:MAG: biotin/lipoyl-containing protein [Candidatus Bathyarchaeia archaeon]
MPAYEILVDGKPKTVEISKTGEKTFIVKFEGEAFTVEVPEGKLISGKSQIKIGDKVYGIALQEVSKTKPFTIKVEEASFKVELKTPTLAQKITPTAEQTIQVFSVRTAKLKQAVSGTVTAPMTGKIISIKVKKGEQVKAGQVLCVLEAMKMENEITAPTAGTVREILISEGASVNEGDPLFVVG